VALRQHGLITQEQATASGMSRRAWYAAAGSGRLVPVAPRVAALPGALVTPEQRIMTAVLTAGSGALASHRSAAHLWGIDGFADAPVDLLLTDRNRSCSLGGACIHTPTDLDDLRPIVRAGIPTTNPLRLLVDLGQVAPGAVPAALERFLFDGTVSRRAVDQTLHRHARRGRPGITALRAALDAWDIDGRPPDSVLELKMAALFARHGLPAARFHARVRGVEVDFAIETARVIVECDGWDTHHRRGQFERDRARDAALAAAGWVVLRFTWSQITRRPAWVASVIRSTIAHRAAA